MIKQMLIICVIFFSVKICAQSIIQNPDYISSNFSGRITRVELRDTVTVLHFLMKAPSGLKFAIPQRTYIENSEGLGKRLFVIKADGIKIKEWNQLSGTDEMRYKLYFPALPKNVKTINYGESNKGGTWFIYKLNLTKDGVGFLKRPSSRLKSYFINKDDVVERKITLKNYLISSRIFRNVSTGITILPKELPESFFGNWYDKYGTLLLIATPEYIVSDSRLQYYSDVKKTSDNTFNITTTNMPFEILNLENDNMVIRTDRLISLTRKPVNNTLSNAIKGDWIHKNKLNRITINDSHFYVYHDKIGGVAEGEKKRIDYVANSKDGNIVYIVLYNEGKYNMFIARKIKDEYVLTPRGYSDGQYRKVKH